jgi:hypothetical protein
MLPFLFQAAVFVVMLAAASASSVAFRVPSADSAVISSQRVGGNFAYSTQENAAWGIVNQPQVWNVATVQQPSVATTYNVANVAAVQQQQPQSWTYTVQPQQQQQQQVEVKNVELKNVPVATSYVAASAVPTLNAWNVAPVTYAVNNVAVQQPQQQQIVQTVQQPQQQIVQTVQQPQQQIVQTETVQKPVQFGYSIHQGGLSTLAVQQQQPIVTVAQPTVYTANSIVEKGTPADTYKTVAGVSPLGFNNVYGYAQPWGYATNAVLV